MLLSIYQNSYDNIKHAYNATNRRSAYLLCFTFNNPLVIILVYEDDDVELRINTF